MAIYNADTPKICVENPTGYVNHILPPTQIIHPYYFGDECTKRTCLWLKGLPKLVHIKQNDLFNEKTHVYKGVVIQPGSEYLFGNHTLSMNNEERRKHRSKTFPGIAKAMSEQWNF